MEQVTRYPERQSRDRALLDALLDNEWWGVLSTIRGDRPVAIPTLFARDGDSILIHGSTGATSLGVRGGGDAVASFCVTAMDELVVAATTFESSVRYRSAVIYGPLEVVPVEERGVLLDRVSEFLVPGRTSEVRPMTKKEIAATNVLRLRIVDGEWVYKGSSGFEKEPEDPTDAWSGNLAFVHGFGEPRRAPWSTAETPASVRRLLETGPDQRN